MGLNPSNGIAERDHGPAFANYAGHENPDEFLEKELIEAGIEVHKHELFRDGKREVNTSVIGTLGSWGFRRAWYYWVAEGAGIPPEYAKELHKTHGRQVRVDGHCGCPGPEYCKGFAVGTYHVDTQDGLKALAETIKKIMKDHESENKDE